MWSRMALLSLAGHLEAVGLLGAHGLQRIEAQHQGAQGPLGGRGGLPGLGRTLGAELGDQLGVDLVGLGAHHPGGAKSLDLGRIDDAHRRLRAACQVLGYRLPIDAGGFHADLERRGAFLGEPVVEGLEAGRGVVDDLVAELAALQAQGAVELGLGDIDAELKRMHDVSSFDQPCECGLPASRAKDTVRSLM